MSRTDALNLARRPFVNARPVARVAVLLWVLGGLLLAANVWLFGSYFAGSGEQRGRLARLDAEIERNRERAGQLETEVAGLDLARQNERVLFLNEKIAERTFSWSLLFDRIAAVLPRDVRLTRLTPATAAEKNRGSGRRGSWRQKAGSNEVTLTIGGEAKTDDAMYQFVDNMFGHPAFHDPNLSRESKNEETGLISFDVQVGYLPTADVPVAEGAAGTEPITVEEEPLASEPGAPLPGQPGQPLPGQPGHPLQGQPAQPSEPAPPTGGAG